jgi:cytochrome c oxidase subunit 1
MHFLGVDGMPRRIYTYPPGMGWDLWNVVATIGAYTLGAGVIVFIVNALSSARTGQIAGPDPWDAMTLEWTIPSPPPHYNFATIPTVRSRDPFWLQKHPELGGHELREDEASVSMGGHHVAHVDIPDSEPVARVDPHSIHMPDPSYWPLVTAFGLFIAGLGVLLGSGLGDIVFDPFIIADYISGAGYYVVTGIGFFITLVGVYGWSFEPVNG